MQPDDAYMINEHRVVLAMRAGADERQRVRRLRRFDGDGVIGTGSGGSRGRQNQR